MSLNETQYNNVPKSSRVFISYSHDSTQHKQCVLQLSNRLCSEGVDCNIDQYETSPPEGWFRWMINQIEEADFVLIVCTENYETRFKGKEEAGKGRGAKWEGAIITQELYYSEANNKCIPIVFSPDDSEYIPSILKSATYYALNIEEINNETYNELYARLTHQKLVLKPDIGNLRHITPRHFISSANAQNKETELAKSNQRPTIGELRKTGSSNEISEFGFPAILALKYKSVEYIGRGGYVKVFKARRQDDKLVAIKLHTSSNTASGKPFISELMNWTSLEHENIVKVYDLDSLPIPYFEVELCDYALSEKQFPLDVTSSTWIIFNICEGLKYAHSKHIIHLNLKPENIFIKQGTPKISDWEFSKVLTIHGTSSRNGVPLLYASPEHISKKFGKEDYRTDIWQIGVIFYKLVTGKTPFEKGDLVTITSSITMKDPELPSSINPKAENLDPIIMKCLEKNQEKRYQSISELQSDLLITPSFFHR